MKHRAASTVSFVNRRFLKLLASASAVLLFGSAVWAAPGKSFKITSFVVNTDGTSTVQWEGADSNIVLETTEDVANPAWQPVPGTKWPVTGTNWTGVIPMTSGSNFLRVVSAGDVQTLTAPVPMKSISLALIGWHNPRSSKFVQNCIACHGARTQERALDGVTPTAHSIMLSFYGQSNDRCITCHYNGPNYSGPNFLTHSAGALRKQVNYEVTGCTACHAKGSIKPLYDRF